MMEFFRHLCKLNIKLAKNGLSGKGMNMWLGFIWLRISGGHL
jgi:hypothetical protein